MSILGTCTNCANSRRHEQMGGLGMFCHAVPPTFVLLPAGRGSQMVGCWAPVDERGWCAQHVAAEPLVRQ